MARDDKAPVRMRGCRQANAGQVHPRDFHAHLPPIQGVLPEALGVQAMSVSFGSFCAGLLLSDFLSSSHPTSSKSMNFASIPKFDLSPILKVNGNRRSILDGTTGCLGAKAYPICSGTVKEAASASCHETTSPIQYPTRSTRHTQSSTVKDMGFGY